MLTEFACLDNFVSLSPSSLISSGRGMKPQWGQVGSGAPWDNVNMSPTAMQPTNPKEHCAGSLQAVIVASEQCGEGFLQLGEMLSVIRPPATRVLTNAALCDRISLSLITLVSSSPSSLISSAGMLTEGQYIFVGHMGNA